ncbi:MAG: regulatory protein RecX [Nitrospirae bacterium]|nr:regulatory protein RecX [Nitrospirota bacterium]
MNLNQYQKKSQKSESSEDRARKYALKLLSYRGRSVKELQERLRIKGFSDHEISSVINYLQHINLINDRLLAEELRTKLIKAKLLSQKSAKKIMNMRGIPKEIIDNILTFDETEDRENAKKLIQKKVISLKNYPVEKIKKKLHDLLLRKGYSYETINVVLKEINLKEE